MKRFFWIFILFLLPSQANAFTLSGFNNPESVVRDPEDSSYYVSNVNGSPSEKDGNGYISKISASGDIVIQRFIGGTKDQAVLDAPKGLWLAGAKLFVADIDSVKIFDVKTKKFLASVVLAEQGAKFLNDVAMDRGGFLYVSDTVADKIFKIDTVKKYQVSVFKDSAELGGPNGLLFNPKNKNLMVATWRTGQILEIDKYGRIHVVKRGLSTLDGLVTDGDGNLYVSNFEKGEIYRMPRLGRGTLTTVWTGLVSPADISYTRKKNELVIPSLNGGTVTAVSTSR